MGFVQVLGRMGDPADILSGLLSWLQAAFVTGSSDKCSSGESGGAVVSDALVPTCGTTGLKGVRWRMPAGLGMV